MKILLTAFEPYDRWDTNSSWESLTEMLKQYGLPEGVTTRRYPVDLETLKQRLDKDLSNGFDAVLHLGQSPGSSSIHLEALAVNVAGVSYNGGRLHGPLIDGGPTAYASNLPIDAMRQGLLQEGIPVSISYHAGTYLCNALFYLSQHWHTVRNRECQVGFVHFPLLPEQVISADKETASVSRLELARGIAIMLEVIRGKPVSKPDAVIA